MKAEIIYKIIFVLNNALWDKIILQFWFGVSWIYGEDMHILIWEKSLYQFIDKWLNMSKLKVINWWMWFTWLWLLNEFFLDMRMNLSLIYLVYIKVMICSFIDHILLGNIEFFVVIDILFINAFVEELWCVIWDAIFCEIKP